MTKYEIGLSITGFRPLKGVEFAEEFYQLLLETKEELIPQRISYGGDSKKRNFDEDNIKNLWVEAEKIYQRYSGKRNGGVIDCTGKDSLFYTIGWNPDNYSRISLNVTEKTLKRIGVKTYIDFIKKLFLLIDGFYGHCFHPSQSGLQYTPGLDYETCIGDITWMALFGLPYVEMFGKETLETAPCWVEEFAENRFMLLTSEEPVEPTPEILERQALVKKHLGEDVFYRHEELPKIYTLEEMLKGSDKEGYRHPDYSKYPKPNYPEVIDLNNHRTKKQKSV